MGLAGGLWLWDHSEGIAPQWRDQGGQETESGNPTVLPGLWHECIHDIKRWGIQFLVVSSNMCSCPEIGQFWDLPVDLPLRISRRLIMRYHEYMLPFFPILMLRSFLGLGRREKTEMLETTGNRPENVSPWNKWNHSKRRTFRPRFNGSLVPNPARLFLIF
jgi:hypothetical protein